MSSKAIIGAITIILIGGAAWYFYDKYTTQDAAQNADLSGQTYTRGSYAYECDEHVTFTMMPSDSMASIKVIPAAGASYPPETTVWKAGEGNYFESESLVFRASGETVTLGEGDAAINCSPVPSQTEAPFNFGV